ncbi:MAG: AMP-binding protein [Bacteroidales bacterium]|nr:AMP-binding protein [Bacteroidales bacterium]MBN2820311.1 AMP-binding protein [Bacteroidales bacterium]
MIKGGADKIALISGDNNITYRQLGIYTQQFSALFSDIKPQSRVGIFSENSLEWIYTFYSILNNKSIPVPIDFMAGIDDVAFIVSDCTPEVIFCSKAKLTLMKEALTLVKYEPRLIIIDDVEINDEVVVPELNIQYNLYDTAVIIYTSGTTGSPKGVMLSFDNLIANVEAVSERVPIYTPSDRLMILLPMHHIFPLLGSLIAPLMVGASAAICPSLNADDIIKTLQRNKITIVIGVPRLYSLIRKGIIDKINQKKLAVMLFKLAKRINSPKFSKIIFKEIHTKFGGSVKSLVSGGAALDPEVGKDFKALGFDILEGFGMTESAPMITFTRPGKFKAGSAGQPVPGVKVESRDGEIVASGRNVMLGYYNRPEETAEVLRDGWLYTGDLGHLDKNGFLFITGRKKEIIVLSNGKNINPNEIEYKLEKHEAVQEVGVFLLSDKLSAIFVPNEKFLKDNKIEDFNLYVKNEIIKPFNERASVSKRILKYFISSDELPRTRLSKLQRFKLEEVALNCSNIKIRKEQPEQKQFKELSTLISFLEEQLATQISPEDILAEDLAIDSLAKITLLVYIENTFGVVIAEDGLNEFKTVHDLANYIREKKTRITPESIDWKEILKEKINFSLPKVGLSFNFFNWSYRALLKSFLRIKADGVTNVPDGPCILVPNHQSFLDGVVVASILKRKDMQKTFFYAKEKYWKRWWQKFVAKKNNIILMDLNSDLKLSIQKMAEVLKKGRKLVIFPEGTRSKDGKLGDFKKTFAILSQELNVPIVPVVIDGAHKAFPVGAKFPRLFKKVKVKFLPPVNPLNHTYETLKSKVEDLVSSHLNKAV